MTSYFTNLTNFAAQALCAATVILFVVLMSSCKREPLELYYTGKAEVRVEVDWNTRFKEVPTGMTIMLAKDGDSITYTDITNSVENYEMQLEPGTYKMLIFNLTTTEFGSMRFFKMKSFAEAFAYAQDLQRITDFWDVNIDYMREPERIGCAVDTFTILPDMVDGEFRFVDYREKIEGNYECLTLHELVEPMTTEMFIKVKVIGIKYMASVIGNISGMANGFLLTQAWRRKEQGYHLLDKWNVTTVRDVSLTRADDTEVLATDTSSVGYITTRINTFGLPHGKEMVSQRDSTSNTLSLMFTLIDDRTFTFRYPVGKDIKYRDAELNGYFNKADVTLDLELEVEAPFDVPDLPYAQPKGTGAFDAEVADWGDEENVDVPM